MEPTPLRPPTFIPSKEGKGHSEGPIPTPGGLTPKGEIIPMQEVRSQHVAEYQHYHNEFILAKSALLEAERVLELTEHSLFLELRAQKDTLKLTEPEIKARTRTSDGYQTALKEYNLKLLQLLDVEGKRKISEKIVEIDIALLT